MRQFHGGGSTVNGPSLLGQQAPGAATVPQPDLMVASMAPDGSGCSGSTSTSREVLAAATSAKMRTAEEATVAKATEEATTTKVATGKAATNKVATDKAVADKVVADKVTAEKVATNKAVTTKVTVTKAATDATAIKTNQLDAQTQKLLHDDKELYVMTVARANTTIK
jgi:hypothetical protein